MKLRSYAPVVIALVAVFVVYRWRTGRDDDEVTPPPAPATQVATRPTPSPAAPALPAPQPATPLQPSTTPPQLPGVAPTKEPHVLTPEEYKGHEAKSKLPKMTLEERIVAAKEHITVMERRLELMKQEIVELDRKGEKVKADEQRVIMKRLEAHAEKLRTDIAAGRDPE